MRKGDRVQELLGLRLPPIAVGFLEAPPEGVPPWRGGEVPAGCAFWLKAMEGEAFYTVPSDHYNCAVGCHTHNIPLPPERAGELDDTVRFMVESKYIETADVPAIPTLSRKPPKVVAYGPVSEATFPADVVLVAATPGQAMLLYEAAVRAGAGDALTNILGRPGCAVLPLTANSGVASLSFGCKGNRTFTGLPENELYLSAPAAKWAAVAAALEEIVPANATMERHYLGRKAEVGRN